MLGDDQEDGNKKRSKKYYLTTPIYYVNGDPHIGTAYTTLAADFIARFKRLDGYDVFFLTGTDEHGQKIARTAEKHRTSPQKFVDKMVTDFKAVMKAMNFSYDDFIRTTEERHVTTVQKVWRKIEENGDIYLGSYSGWYSVRDECFYTEKEIQGGKAPTGAPVEWVEEKSYFFRLSQYQDKLLQFYKENKNFIRPKSAYNEVVSFVKSGLQDLSISRTTFDWGIKVPGDDEHVVYVWLDALVNYFSAAESKRRDEDDAQENFWPCDLHLIGKDILRFHAVYWPAFLMSAGIPLPKRIFSHGWWTNKGEKMSKSLGNVINPLDLVNKFGVDYTRYFLMREVPFGKDGDFSEDVMIKCINSELVNNIGNLAQRVISFAYSRCGGQIPEVALSDEDDLDMISEAYDTLDAVQKAMNEQKLHEVLKLVVALGTKSNVYMDNMEPWKVYKFDPKRAREVIYTLMEVIRVMGILLLPIIPSTANAMLEQLQVPPKDRTFSRINKRHQLSGGTKLEKPYGIFPRL